MIIFAVAGCAQFSTMVPPLTVAVNDVGAGGASAARIAGLAHVRVRLPSNRLPTIVRGVGANRGAVGVALTIADATDSPPAFTAVTT